MTNTTVAQLLMIFARACKEAADLVGDSRVEDPAPEKDKPAASKSQAKRQTTQRKSAAPKVKKEDVIKKFQELSKGKGGRAKIDDILEDHLPEGTPLKASNLKPAQYASVLEATQAIIDEEAANPDTPDDDEGFE